MKKSISVLLMMLLVMTMAACGSTQQPAGGGDDTQGNNASADPVVNLTLGTTSAAEDLQTKALEKFAELAKEKSGGSILISVFPASQLGDATTEMESVIAGGQDMFMESELTYLNNYGIEELGAESFGPVATRERIITASNSEWLEECRETFRQNNGVVTVGYNFYRQPIVMATQKEMNTLDDFKGYKLRVVPSESTLASYSALGFNPTSVAYNEVYLSLSQGVIEGTIGALDAMYTMKFYEVAPYILKLGVSTTNMACWINEAKWNTLTENQQNILKETCAEAGDWYSQENEIMIEEYIEEMEAQGAQVKEASDELWAQCFEIWEEAAKEFEAEGKMPVGSYDKLDEAANG